MAADQFAERLAQVRARFATKLQTRIDALDESLPHIRGSGDAVIETLTTAHRGMHDLCGIGPTIGFDATGRAARHVEQILLAALRAGRGLNDQETNELRDAARALREAARDDLQAHNLAAV